MNEPETFDVIIVGAGLSGIGAGVRLKSECPNKTFVILEGRGAIGGTWDLFRYPGIRSDSDMFTLGYPFFPWTGAKTMASGNDIREYIERTASTFGIHPHVRLEHRILSADWSPTLQCWNLEVAVGPERTPQSFRCRFLHLCSGYYSYERAHAPELPHKESFGGRIVHPQWWPEDLDYGGKRVVVLGSGATAITLVPALARGGAAHVTMLQRSPTYVFSLPSEDVLSQRLRRWLPLSATHRIVRGKNVTIGAAFYQFCRRSPKLARRFIRAQVKALLPPGYPIDEHFKPRYDPWDERLCVVPDGDFFAAIRNGTASVVTDTIDRLAPGAIRLASGREIPADILVTATGLELQFGGGIPLSIDGVRVMTKDTFVYKGVMLEGVPNLACSVGYTNASWTLRADLSARYVCRLLRHMDDHGYKEAVARARPEESAAPGPALLGNLASGYVKRAADILPRQGTRAPWIVRQNYVLDFAATMLGRVDDAVMHFA
ncbi:MAG: NAD(P)/FAD-dependent oxidoreductase [Polyangiaceae bacterium]